MLLPCRGRLARQKFFRVGTSGLANGSDRGSLKPLHPHPAPSRSRWQGGAARLAELEYFFLKEAPAGSFSQRAPASGSTSGGGGGGGYDPEAKVKALWVWDLSQDLSGVFDDPALRHK